MLVLFKSIGNFDPKQPGYTTSSLQIEKLYQMAIQILPMVTGMRALSTLTGFDIIFTPSADILIKLVLALIKRKSTKERNSGKNEYVSSGETLWRKITFYQRDPQK